MKKDTYTLHIHTASHGLGDTLRIHIAGGGKVYTLLFILLAVEIKAPRRSIRTAGIGGGERYTHCMPKLQVLERYSTLLYDAEKSYGNAKMLERRKKNIPASAFLPVVHCLSPALAFWHQGSVWYRWSQNNQALASYDFLAQRCC